MKMKALQYVGQRDIRLSEVDIPKAQDDEVILRVTDAGLCQTQVNEFIEGPFIIQKLHIPKNSIETPLIVGHQFGGTVDSASDPDCSDMIGKQAAVLPLLSCGKCECCRSGKENLCDDMSYYGLIGKDGGFANYACIKTDNLFFVEDRSLITFIEPLLVAIHAGNMIKNDIHDKAICIFGGGTIGICVAAVFRDYFGGRVVVKDILPNRLKRAQEAGFATMVNGDQDSYFDVVVDCAGNNPTSRTNAFEDGLGYLKKNGILVGLGTYFHPASIIPAVLLVNEFRIVASYLYNKSDVQMLPHVLDKLTVDFSRLILKVGLDNIVEDGYYRAEVDNDSFTRLVVVP